MVAQVEWITVERSQYPKRKGMQDFGLVDLPYPLRKMSLNPLGILSYTGGDSDKDRYEFKRGVQAYPSVGDQVLLPTQVSFAPSSSLEKTAASKSASALWQPMQR